MLEDDFTYVLRKALAGHQLTPADASAQAGIAEHAVLSFLRGAFSAETARRLAPVIGLNPDVFAHHPSHQPKPLSLPQIHRLDLPFSDGQVNAWLVETGGERILFDAGFEIRDLILALERHGGRLPDRLFITHGHRDHIGGLDHLLRAGVPVHSAGLPGTITMKPGDTVFCGRQIVRACDLSGHFTPALGLIIEGLQTPVLVTGDALFAGSIGGCATPALHQQALRNLRTALALLPDQTVILPGHGPATTLGDEHRGNPFL
jgi:glyoxylase-like metal-dependent hydrolase (beta-lactamase superfamily II)